jgi:ribosomal protein L7/L12
MSNDENYYCVLVVDTGRSETRVLTEPWRIDGAITKTLFGPATLREVCGWLDGGRTRGVFGSSCSTDIAVIAWAILDADSKELAYSRMPDIHDEESTRIIVNVLTTRFEGVEPWTTGRSIIPAIKALREYVPGCGLKDAKDRVEGVRNLLQDVGLYPKT